MEICVDCERQLDILRESDDKESYRKAFNHVYTCYENTPYDEVKAFLYEIIEINKPFVLNEVRKSANISVDFAETRDYYSEQKPLSANNSASNGGNGWISGLKGIAWLCFAGIIIIGFVTGTPLLNNENPMGLVIIGGAVLIGFVMVFLNMAEDISKIRSWTERN